MKELTIEEKAKAYDEAIKKAKGVIEQNPLMEYLKKGIEYIIPELKESKDEVIKKAIGYAIGQSTHSDGTLINGVSSEEALAWLEKQYSNVDNANEEYWRGYREGKQEILDKYAELEKQGEQKSNTDFSDLITWKYIVDAVWTEKEGIGQYLDSPFAEEVAKKLQKRFGNIKQSWSEEDSRILYNVKAYIGYAAGQRGVKDELFKEANEWLNSLPIGFVYNKNYNEDMVTLLVGELKQIANDNNAPEQYQVEINWLKSLRPQKQWEPSEEQIKALHDLNLTGNISYAGQGQVLIELYNDLKKLKRRINL